MMHKRYTKEQLTAVEAQRLAQEIAFGPVVFQVSRLMLKFGIFQLLADKRKGYTLQEISVQTGLTRYAAQVLLEASLTIGTILLEEDRYVLVQHMEQFGLHIQRQLADLIQKQRSVICCL